MKNKLDDPDFYNYINNHDVLLLTECWNSTDSNLNIKGYDMFTCPRPKWNRRAKRNSGGVVVYYKSIYKNVIEKVSINPKGILWFRIKTESSLQDIYVCLCYIPPEDSKVYKNTTSLLFEYDFFQQLNSDIRKYSEKGKVYITGDFNSRTGEQLDFVPEMHLERYLDVPTNNSSAISLPQRKNNDKVVNEYGRKLIALCKETDVSIVNGRLEEGNFIQSTEIEFHLELLTIL